MTDLFVTTRDGARHTVRGTPGRSVMELIRDSGVDGLLALCGGSCSCATCHVYVAEQSIPKLQPPSSGESDLLECSAHRRANSRLACQIPFTAELAGLSVEIAPED